MENAIRNIVSSDLFTPRLYFHLLFWVIVSAASIVLLLLFNHSLYSAVVVKALFLPFQLIAAYFLIWVCIERMLFKQKYFKFIIVSLLFTFLFSLLTRFIMDGWVWPRIQENFNKISWWEMITDVEGIITYYMRIIFILPFILICFEVAFRQKEKGKEMKKLMSEKAEVELDLLKTQMHPHFILATLRNLEELTKEHDERGPEVVEKLADSLEFILYEGPQKLIPIKKELGVIDHLIDLLKMRYQDVVEIVHHWKLQDGDQLIPPLIIFSFIEYNFIDHSENDLFYDRCEIRLIQSDGNLNLCISNKLLKNKSLRPYPIDKMNKQLALAYAGKFSLEENIRSDIQEISLNLMQ